MTPRAGSTLRCGLRQGLRQGLRRGLHLGLRVALHGLAVAALLWLMPD